MSALSLRLEKTSTPAFDREGRTSSPDPEVSRSAGPLIRQLLGEMETCHKLTLSPAFAVNKTRSSTHWAGAGRVLRRAREIFCAAKDSNAPVLMAFPPATGHTHQSSFPPRAGES